MHRIIRIDHFSRRRALPAGSMEGVRLFLRPPTIISICCSTIAAFCKPCCIVTPRSQRRGSVLVVAMVALLLTSLVLGSLLRMASMQHRQLRSEQNLLQAEWLGESALNRAAARLANEPSYSGETWNITASEIGGRSAGQVTIAVEQSADRPMERIVSVNAVYPSDETYRITKRSKQVIVTVIAKP